MLLRLSALSFVPKNAAGGWGMTQVPRDATWGVNTLEAKAYGKRKSGKVKLARSFYLKFRAKKQSGNFSGIYASIMPCAASAESTTKQGRSERQRQDASRTL